MSHLREKYVCWPQRVLERLAIEVVDEVAVLSAPRIERGTFNVHSLARAGC